MGVLLVGLAAGTYFYRTRYLRRDLVLSVLICGMVVSSHFVVVRHLGNGKRDAEFKYLADWYVQHAQPGEQLVTTLPDVVKIFAPKHKNNFIHLSHVGGETPEAFVRHCLNANITYVAWDSRLGNAKGSSYYINWKMDRIAMLIRPQDNGPYRFLDQVKVNKQRYINIFRLVKPGEGR
jgi:hypothetical protein